MLRSLTMKQQIHLGSGIMLFRNVLSDDEEMVKSYLNRLTSITSPQGFSKKDWTEKYVSDGGYEFERRDIAINPSRFTDIIFDSITKEEIDLVEHLEAVFYECLVMYCRLFPVAMRDIKWRTRGYVIRYEYGQYIGPHSDTSIPYKGDSLDSDSMHPMQNTLTGSICLNKDFEGGRIVFRNWGVGVDQKFGDVLLYPSSFIGCHEVQPVTSGERYAYLGWFGHGQTNMIQPPNSTDQSIQMVVKRTNNLEKDVGSEFLEQNHVLVGPVDMDRFTTCQ